jgi:hypothetical protein
MIYVLNAELILLLKYQNGHCCLDRLEMEQLDVADMQGKLLTWIWTLRYSMVRI